MGIKTDLIKQEKERKKKEILEWCEKNKTTPKRDSENPYEVTLASRMHNYISPSADSYDPKFRRAMKKFGVISRKKRKHNREKRKKEVISFIEKHGRVPSSMVKAEKRIHATYAGLISPAHNEYDPEFKKELKEYDKCLGSHIPLKFRRSINEAMHQSGMDLIKEKTFAFAKKTKT